MCQSDGECGGAGAGDWQKIRAKALEKGREVPVHLQIKPMLTAPLNLPLGAVLGLVVLNVNFRFPLRLVRQFCALSKKIPLLSFCSEVGFCVVLI